MSQDAQLLKLAFAYAGAVGKLSGTMRVLIDHGDAYTEQEKIAMMLESLIDADKQIDNASK
jgi:hypothetical protein